MKKYLFVFPPILAFLLELLPFGAVLVFSVGPNETTKSTFSYFSLTPFGYANFAPFLTALLTCAILLCVFLFLLCKKKKVMQILFLLSLIASILSLGPLVFGLSYFSWIGAVITLLLAAEAFLTFRLYRNR